MAQDGPAASTKNQPNSALGPPPAWTVGAMAVGLPATAEDRTRFHLALARLEAYAQAAGPQAERVALAYHADVAFTRETNGMVSEGLRAAALVQAHYYFITWQGARIAFGALRNNRSLRLRTPREVWRKYEGHFDSYTEARDHLEHYDERLPGGEESDWAQLTPNTITGTVPMLISETSFCFKGKTWDVGRASAEALMRLFTELLIGLRDEIRARLAEPGAGG